MTMVGKDPSSRRWVFKKSGKKSHDENIIPSAKPWNPSVETLPPAGPVETQDQIHNTSSRHLQSNSDTCLDSSFTTTKMTTDSLIDSVMRHVTSNHAMESVVHSPLPPDHGERHFPQRDPSHHWKRTDVHDFVSSFPLRYALSTDNPHTVLLHMNMLEAVRIHGPCFASVHVTSSSMFQFCSSRTEGSRNSSEGEDSSSHHGKYTKSVTVMCPPTVGLLEFVMGLWEAGGSQILDCNVLMSKHSILLIQAIVQVKGGLKLDQLQEQIQCFLRISSGLPVTHVNIPVSARFGSPDPSRVPSHVHPDHREQVITDTENIGYQFFDPYDPLLDPEVDETANRREGCPELSRRQLDKAYLKKPTLLYDVIGFGLRDKLGPKTDLRTFPMAREEKTESMDISASSNHSLGNSSATSSSARRKLVRRSASIDLDQSISSHAISLFTSKVDTLPRIMVTATIKGSSPVRVFQGYLCGGTDDKLIHSFVNQKKDFENLPELLALKVAHFTKDIDSTKLLEDLTREGKIAESLDHINVCKLVLKYSSPEICLLGYEYCSRGSLCSILCDDTKQFDYLPLAMDIAQGMAYLHSKNIIHRDLKPSNIFVDRNNRAKIADFGMCAANNGDSLSGETGTYRWMSPEIIRHEPYSTKTDVYSFGICLWQLVTRCPQPFSDMNPIQAAYAVAKGVRPPIPSHVPDFIRQIITACWDDDQLKRPTFANIYLGLSAYSNISVQQDYSI